MSTAPACLLLILTMFGHDIFLCHDLDACSLEVTFVVILGNTKEN